MSDRSSESSEEWLLLNLDEDPSLEDTMEESLNSVMNLDSSSLASEAIQYSELCEELQQANGGNVEECPYLPPYDPSSIEEIEIRDHEIPIKLKNDTSDDSASYTDYEKDYNFNLASIHKTQCYKHNPNHRVNFMLNMMLALAVSSAVGFGTGYFLGWSHRCWENDADITDETDKYVLPSQAVIYQVVESVGTNENIDSSEKLFTALKLPVEMENIVPSHIKDTVKSSGLNTVSVVSSVLYPNDVSLKTVRPHSFNVSHQESISDLNIVTNANGMFDTDASSDTKPISDLRAVFNKNANADTKSTSDSRLLSNVNIIADTKSTSDSRGIPSVNVIADVHVISDSNTDILMKPPGNVSTDLEHDMVSNLSSEVDWSKVVVPLDYINQQFTNFVQSVVTDSKDDLNSENKSSSKLIDPLLNFSEKDKSKSKSNFTVQLRDDLLKVVQSLNAIAISQLSNDKINLGLMSKCYQDLRSVVVAKMYFIDNFVQNENFGKYPKQSVKHLQKMIYCLIDFMDSVVKSSLRTFAKNNHKINANRLSKNLFKTVFTFNKKWEHFQKKWAKNVDRVQNKQFKLKHLKDFKITSNKESEQKSFKNFDVRSAKEFKVPTIQRELKPWKRNLPIENPEKPNFKRYSIKS